MSESTILTDDQITTSALFAAGSIRPQVGEPFTTYEKSLTVTVELTNYQYPNPPQLGKVDILDAVSENIASYVVYYLQVRIPACTHARTHSLTHSPH